LLDKLGHRHYAVLILLGCSHGLVCVPPSLYYIYYLPFFLYYIPFFLFLCTVSPSFYSSSLS
jgi:hypothetical protein